ncbi:unnamed protein product [Lymnaea stagnalis]|uniref:D-isomer specific 2-hydroxyacid dehydrogenase NAD-binding domain-containing protein n=1 Tax=Lymnaea stagnalis TaxID=6523 RepID=A0AAV2H435_LYMST
MATKACVEVSKVFVVSKISNIASCLKKSIGDVIVQELSFSTSENSLSEEGLKIIPEIEYLFADPSVIGQVLSDPGNSLKWAQSTFAGVEPIIKAVNKIEEIPSAIVCRQTGGFGQSMGEYVIGQIIARERKFSFMNDLQRQSSYDDYRSDLISYRNLDTLSIGILGLGTIGAEVARQCKALNMTVWATLRDERFISDEVKCEHVHNFRPISLLHEMVLEVDYLVNILPSTMQTRGLLSGEVLKSCEKKKTVFINIGRGDVVDDESLVQALNRGWLGGAILDVFNTEPLPSSSPLWKTPGVTITPHVSGITDTNKAVQTFMTNLQLYRAGQPMINRVDFRRGY